MQIPVKRHKCLVYSSIGDNTNMPHWLPERQFDLWLTYYGDNTDLDLSDQCEFFLHKKGAKFPNFFALFQEFKSVVAQYDYVMIADDDLIFSGADINLLFSIMQQHNLSLAQPAFDLCGKVSHPATKMHPLSQLRYTSFVEVACPVFSTPYLLDFMAEYDPVVVGWGADWWFSHLVEQKDKGKQTIAVVDAVTCLNPLDRDKTNGREIDRFQSKAKRIEIWAGIKQSRGLNIDEVVRESGIVRDYVPLRLFKYLNMRVKWLFQRLAMKLGA